jgi:hypothetical protein
VGGVVLRDHQQAGRVAIEAVDDARPPRIVAARGPAGERLHQRPAGMAGRRVDHHPGRLVHHQQVVVLVGDLVRRRVHVALHGDRRRRRLHLLPRLQPVALGTLPAIDGHPPVVDQPLRGRARAHRGGQRHVEALARVLVRRREANRLGHSRGPSTM